MTSYRTVSIDGLDIFYREAGSRDHQTILLHGFPTSSHMFRNLLSALADRFYLVAPDYPSVSIAGYGALRSGGRQRGDRRSYLSVYDYSHCQGGHHASS